MKKAIVCLLLLTVIAAVPAYASEEIFGGTALWPEINGMQLGLSLPYVLLQEEYVNGNDPQLVSIHGTTLDEIAGNEMQISQVRYLICTTDIFGAECEISYIFDDNILTTVKCSGTVASEEEALKWQDEMTEYFCSIYGDTYYDFPYGESEHTNNSYRSWMLYTSQTPYNIKYEKDEVTMNFLPREYIRAGEFIGWAEDGDTYTVKASIEMRYNYATEEQLIEGYGLDFGEDGFFTDDRGSDTTLKDLYEEYGEYAEKLFKAKYHDWRYYIKH